MGQQDLSRYFKFWDHFFEAWKYATSQSDPAKGYQDRINGLLSDRSIEPPILGFPNTDIYNCSCETTHTFEYIPEPYWGGWNDKSGHDLKMVVVNLNPASGGKKQHFSSGSGIWGKSSYSDYVIEQVNSYCKATLKGDKGLINQYNTSKWHNKNRAEKLMHGTCKNDNEYPDPLKHYLGIDLVPWHTPKFKSLGMYPSQNIKSINKWALEFAIDASESIKDNDILKGIVAVRSSLKSFKAIFKDKFECGEFSEVADSALTVNKESRVIIKIKDRPNSKFCLLSGFKNDLPSKDFLKGVFNP